MAAVFRVSVEQPIKRRKQQDCLFLSFVLRIVEDWVRFLVIKLAAMIVDVFLLNPLMVNAGSTYCRGRGFGSWSLSWLP